MPSLGLGLGLQRGLRSLISYVKSGRVLDLFSSFSSSSTTIPDSSPESNDATLYTGRFLSTDGVSDRGIQADCSAAGAGTYYLTGKVKPTAVTVARMTIDGATSSTVTGLTANVWQDFQTATSGSITPSSIVVGWDGTTASAADWSDVRLINAATGATVAHWQLNDSADADLGGYPAIDSSGNEYHGTHTGCAGGTSEATILQTAGMDWNKDTTTYVGKTILVPERDALDGFDALGNAIAEPRVNSSQFNFFGDGEYASVADADSLDLTTTATWELWLNPLQGSGMFISKYDSSPNNRSWYFSDASGGIRVAFGNGTGGFSGSADWNGLSDAVQCFHATFDGGVVEGFVNGVSIGAPVIASGTIPSSLYAGTAPILIGANLSAGVAGVFLDILIGRPKIYNRALSADEVLQNFTAQKGAFGL